MGLGGFKPHITILRFADFAKDFLKFQVFWHVLRVLLFLCDLQFLKGPLTIQVSRIILDSGKGERGSYPEYFANKTLFCIV